MWSDENLAPKIIDLLLCVDGESFSEAMDPEGLALLSRILDELMPVYIEQVSVLFLQATKDAAKTHLDVNTHSDNVNDAAAYRAMEARCREIAEALEHPLGLHASE